MKPRKIKRFWFLGLTTMLLSVAGVVLSILWPRLFPTSEVSDLYRRYEHNDHIRATEIHNFPVNDTLAVETLLLQAATDSAWCALLADFGAPKEFLEMYNTNRDFFVREKANSILHFSIEKNNPQKRIPLTDPDSWLVIGNLSNRTLCIFLTEETNIKKQISYFETKKLKDED